MNLSIKAKSTALFAAYLLALVAVYSTFSLRLLQQESHAVVDRLQQTATLLAAEVDTVLASGRQRLETVGRLPGLVFGLESITRSADGGEIPAWTTLHYLFFKTPVYTGGVFLLDRAGVVLWNEPPDRSWRGLSLASHPVVREARERGGTVVSDALAADDILDGPHAIVVHPIRPRGGEIVGFLGGVIDLRETPFREIVNAASATDDRFVVIVDGRGRTIAGNTGRPILSEWRPPEGEHEAVLASATIDRTPWRVWAGQGERSAFANVGHLQRLLIALGLVLLAGSLLVGAIVIRDFTRSIAGLTRHAEIMAAGRLSEPVVLPPRRDELGTLARTFERMRAELERSHQALETRLTERDELLRLKEEFLANTSHELRTPLNVIFGYAEMLEDGEPSGERRAVLDGIRSQAGRLLELFDDLMTLSGANAGKLQLRTTRIEVAALIARLAPLADRLAGEKDLTVLWDVPPDLPPVWSDEIRLEQVLSNLLTNAIKFTPAGKVAFHVRSSEDRMTFVVSDTGRGIPFSELPHIFDEFRQVDGSMSREHGGMGLGLAVVKKLVTLLGGEIHVRSLEGFGSMFSVSLPLGGDEAVQPAAPRAGGGAAA
jgi:signal transduction histidine kinase